MQPAGRRAAAAACSAAAAAACAGRLTPCLLLAARCSEAHDGPLAFDLGNLMASDVSAVDPAAFAGPGGADAGCHRLATTIFQSLAARLFALPSEAAPVGRIAALPPPATVLPREKPIPKPRPPTKWEVFAQVRLLAARREGVGGGCGVHSGAHVARAGCPPTRPSLQCTPHPTAAQGH